MKRLHTALAGGARVEITGLSLERLLGKLSAEFEVFDVVRVKQNKLILSLLYANLKKLFAFTAETCYNVCVLKTWGLLPLLDGLKRRVALAAGAAAALIAAVTLSCFCWRVDVAAPEGYDPAKLKQFLAENGVRAGVPVFALSEDDVEREVYLNFPQLAFVSCTRRGVSLKVSVVPALAGAAVNPQTGNKVAAYGGVVSRVVVESGTALVKPGDRIEAGQEVIGGYLLNGEEQIPAPALGEVYVVQDVYHTELVSGKREVKSRTGRYVEKTQMRVFGLTIPVKDEENVFAEYETETYSYYPFQNNYLGVRMEVTRYYEVLGVSEDINFEAGKTIYYEFALQNALAGLDGDYTVINRVVEDAPAEDGIEVRVLLQIERRV